MQIIGHYLALQWTFSPIPAGRGARDHPDSRRQGRAGGRRGGRARQREHGGRREVQEGKTNVLK